MGRRKSSDSFNEINGRTNNEYRTASKGRRCRFCHEEIPSGVRRCPYCGKNQGRVGLWIVCGILLFFAVVIVIASIGSSISNNKQENLESEDAISNSSEVVSEESEETNIKEELSIDEAVIYEGYDTIVKTTGEIKDSSSYVQIGLYFENNSNLNLDYCIHSYAVNGIMSDESYYVSSTEIAAGKKASATLDISKSWLDECGIDEIQYINILFWAYDTDTIFKSFESDVIQIETNFYNGPMEYSNGTELYSSARLTVRLLSLDDNSMIFTVTDHSDQYFDLDIKNVSINDWTYDTGISVYNEQILPSCMGIYEVPFDSDFKETNGISSVENVEFALYVEPLGQYSNASSTDPIIVNREDNE